MYAKGFKSFPSNQAYFVSFSKPVIGALNIKKTTSQKKDY